MNIRVLIELKCRSISLSRGLKKAIKKHVFEWTKLQVNDNTEQQVHFEVTFERKQGQIVNCYTRIISQVGEWMSVAWGRNPQEAFKNCLSQLS
jgi:hypothetical protein